MRVRKVFYTLFTILMTLLLLFVSSKVLKRKYSDNEYRRFYKNSSDYEVLFFGPSVVHYSISPMQLWNDYGITSYNMANDSERLTMTYYNIINSLDYCSPKVIVVALDSMAWAGSKRDNTLKDHNFIDAVPLSTNKIREVKEVFEKNEFVEYLVPFTLYHSRWNELSKEDFEIDNNVMYGIEPQQGIFSMQTPTDDQYEESRFGKVEEEAEVLDKIIELCNNKDIELVFIYLPSGVRGGDQKLREYCSEYLADKEVPYLDMLYLDTIEYNRDFYDAGHTNVFGSQKVTDCIGDYLNSNYELTDYRENEDYCERWGNNYLEYKEKIRDMMSENQEEYDALAQ